MYQLNREKLHQFVDEKLDLIERTPFPDPLVVREMFGEIANMLDEDQQQGMWLFSGLATQVGLEILEKPQEFLSPEWIQPAQFRDLESQDDGS